MPADDTIPDALADALGRVVAECRREWQQELELLRAERRALVAELRLAALGTPSGASEPAPAAKGKAKAGGLP